jgi:hypothetical protein
VIIAPAEDVVIPAANPPVYLLSTKETRAPLGRTVPGAGDCATTRLFLIRRRTCFFVTLPSLQCAAPSARFAALRRLPRRRGTMQCFLRVGAGGLVTTGVVTGAGQRSLVEVASGGQADVPSVLPPPLDKPKQADIELAEAALPIRGRPKLSSTKRSIE